MKELNLNKREFSLFNQGDQFQLFTNNEDYKSYEDFDEAVEKLFKKYEHIVVKKNGYIYAETNGKRVLLSDQSNDSYHVAIDAIVIIGGIQEMEGFV